MEGLTASNEDEREEAIGRVEATLTGDLLFHESVHPANPRRYSRRWFSWADMLYVELVLATAGITAIGTRSPQLTPRELRSRG